VHGPVRERIVDILLRCPNGVTSGALMDAVYCGTRGGGPSSRNIMHVNIHHANVELATLGYRIITDRGGPGSLYKLVTLDADTKCKPLRSSDGRTVGGTQSTSHARDH